MDRALTVAELRDALGEVGSLRQAVERLSEVVLGTTPTPEPAAPPEPAGEPTTPPEPAPPADPAPRPRSAVARAWFGTDRSETP